jgi:type IV pilus assembly protein PilE
MKSQRGFTLLELMAVVAIIAILALIAFPSYSEFIRRGKRSEALSAISDIQLREERWRADNPLYGTMLNLFTNAAGVTAYNNSHSYYDITIAATPDGSNYTVTATRKGSMANDPKCGDFIMTYSAGTSTPSMSSGDTTYCWRK